MQLNDKWVQLFVTESNMIEGIDHDPTDQEIAAARDFLSLESISLNDMIDFVASCASAPLRRNPGMDVRVGDYVPPPGGPAIGYSLDDLLRRANDSASDPYDVHVEYETLHPFMDGNGRSGRVLWAWMMRQREDPDLKLGFLHAWYYQSLSASRK